MPKPAATALSFDHFSDKNSRELFGLRILKNAHPDARTLRKLHGEASIHGNKFWKSTTVLMDYLRDITLEPGMRVLELGCGWGLGGIFCAKEFGADVVSLDADESVLPYAEYHAQLNGVETDTIAARFEDISIDDLAQFDLIIGADICFWDELADLLHGVIEKAINAGVPRIILTDPGRPPFRELAEHIDTVSEEEPDLGLEVIYSDWDVPEPYNQWGLVLDIARD